MKKLYSDVIKKHLVTPYHFEKMPSLRTIKAYNPICGDRFEIFMEPGESLGKLYFHGFGCAISKASTSMMMETLEGKSRKEAVELCDRFLRFLRKEMQQQESSYSEEWQAFSGVHEFPERLDCAALSWQAMRKFLAAEHITSEQNK